MSHGVMPFFLYDRKQTVSSSGTRDEVRMWLTKLRPSLRWPRLLSTLLGSPRAISRWSWRPESWGNTTRYLLKYSLSCGPSENW